MQAFCYLSFTNFLGVETSQILKGYTMKNVNEHKTYSLENHTIYTVNGIITLAKSKQSGKFINHVIAQMILNKHLKEQKLSYMIINAVTVITVLKFLNVLVNKTVNALGTVNKFMYRFKLIDLFMLVIGSIDLILYCKWIA